MNTCRKTHRKCAVAELIRKIDRKLERKGTQATGGDRHFCVGNIYSLGWISM